MLLHLALASSFPQNRRAVLDTIEASTIRSPQLTNRIVREALTCFLLRDSASNSKAVSGLGEEQVTPGINHGHLSVLLFRCVSVSDDLDISEKEDILVELIILSHHSLACKSTGNLFLINYVLILPLSGSTSRQTWIALCQKARIDPHDLVNRNLDKLFNIILAASAFPSKVST